jgi:hypothetical protein
MASKATFDGDAGHRASPFPLAAQELEEARLREVDWLRSDAGLTRSATKRSTGGIARNHSHVSVTVGQRSNLRLKAGHGTVNERYRINYRASRWAAFRRRVGGLWTSGALGGCPGPSQSIGGPCATRSSTTPACMTDDGARIVRARTPGSGTA